MLLGIRQGAMDPESGSLPRAIGPKRSPSRRSCHRACWTRTIRCSRSQKMAESRSLFRDEIRRRKTGGARPNPLSAKLLPMEARPLPKQFLLVDILLLTLRFSQPATVGFSSPGRKYKEAEMMCNSFAEEKEESEITLQALPWLFPWFI